MGRDHKIPDEERAALAAEFERVPPGPGAVAAPSPDASAGSGPSWLDSVARTLWRRGESPARNAHTWAGTVDINAKPWLLLGKGPSYRKVEQIDVGAYFVCSLNHVVRQLPVKLAHMIDIDVVDDCEAELERNAELVVLPYHPHVKHKPTHKTVHDFVAEKPVLQRLASAGRLLWYNLSTSKPGDESPVIRAKFFSAEAALSLLASCGAKVVRSLGVDGGNQYSAEFKDLEGKTLLANTHSSFDRQFEGMARTIRETQVLYGPLTVKTPVRVFVGADRAQLAGVKVLEYSIKRRASLSVEVVPIDDRDVPVPRDPKNRSRTGFSFSRFHIPALCKHRGRAIYMDADMLVFADVLDLWKRDFEGAQVLYSERSSGTERLPQFSVMLLDCERLDWDVRTIVEWLDTGRYDYSQLMHQLALLPPDGKRAGLPAEWNSLEHYEEGKTRLIHYTDMPTQPWVTKKNKHGALWYRELRAALQEGFISKDFLYEEVELGNVSPELPLWVGLPPPRGVQELRESWVPPYRRFVKPAAS